MKSLNEFLNEGKKYKYDLDDKDEIKKAIEFQKLSDEELEKRTRNPQHWGGTITRAARAEKKRRESLNEGKKYKFKKGDKVKIHDDWKDDPKEDFTYELLENPDGGRVKIQAIDTKLSLPPVEVVKLDWIVPA